RSRSPASPEPPESGARTVPSAPPAGGSPPSPPPAPLPRPAPSFSTVSTTRPSTVRTVTAHQVASPCRSTFVVASRTTQPSADCTREIGRASCRERVELFLVREADDQKLQIRTRN